MYAVTVYNRGQFRECAMQAAVVEFRSLEHLEAFWYALYDVTLEHERSAQWAEHLRARVKHAHSFVIKDLDDAEEGRLGELHEIYVMDVSHWETQRSHVEFGHVHSSGAYEASRSDPSFELDSVTVSSREAVVAQVMANLISMWGTMDLRLNQPWSSMKRGQKMLWQRQTIHSMMRNVWMRHHKTLTQIHWWLEGAKFKRYMYSMIPRMRAGQRRHNISLKEHSAWLTESLRRWRQDKNAIMHLPFPVELVRTGGKYGFPIEVVRAGGKFGVINTSGDSDAT